MEEQEFFLPCVRLKSCWVFRRRRREKFSSNRRVEYVYEAAAATRSSTMLFREWRCLRGSRVQIHKNVGFGRELNQPPTLIEPSFYLSHQNPQNKPPPTHPISLTGKEPLLEAQKSHAAAADVADRRKRTSGMCN
jgi:hypothetical protein